MHNLEHFQDREAAIQAFDRLWQQPSPWILAFTGFSGHGKTTLLNWLEVERCLPRGIPYALIGLESFKEDLSGLLNGLVEHPGLRPHLLRVKLQAFARERRAALEELSRRSLAITQSQVMEGSQGSQQMSANVAEALRQMKHQADQRVVEAWLECLGVEERPTVFLLDNYDVFQERPVREVIEGFWTALERAHQFNPGLRVVLASREPVRHRSYLRSLENGLGSEELEPLTRQDSAALLAAMGVDDPPYQEAVFSRLAQGHPLITRIAGQAWVAAQGQIEASEVPRLASHEEAIQWVHGKILDRLSGGLKKAVRWAALLRGFDANLLEAILGVELTEDEFEQLIHYAFVNRPRTAPGAWACHDLIRRVQIAYLRRERPQDFTAFHQRAAAYFQEQHVELEALYHRFFYDPQGAFQDWAKLESQAAFQFEHPAWEKLIEIGLAPELVLDPVFQAEILYRSGRRHYYRAEWASCTEYLHQSLGLFRAVGDRLGEANVLKAIGDVQQFRDEREAALASYAEALGLFRAVGDRLGEANCIKSLGDVHLRLAEYPQARARYEAALPLYQEIGARLGEANCIKSLGELFAAEGDHEAAFKLLEDAVRQFGDLRLPHRQAGALNSIANIYDERKEHLLAIQAYTKALEYSPEGAGYILRNRAYQYIKLQDVKNAEFDLQSAEKLQSDHPYLYLRKGQLALLKDKLEDALILFASALERMPRLNEAYFGIGLVHLRSGNFTEALMAYQTGLSFVNSNRELEDAIIALERLKASQPELAGVDEALTLLRQWKPQESS